MENESWDRMVPSPGEDEVARALERVRARAVLCGAMAARRRRLMALAAAFVLTFAAGWMAGRSTAYGGSLWAWAAGGRSVEEGRATFVAVPASDQ